VPVPPTEAQHILTAYWTLNDPQNADVMRELIDAIEAQRNIPGVLSLEHGPRTLKVDWEGPQDSFDYGMVLAFDNFDSARAYVPHPIHQKLVAIVVRTGSDIRGYWIDRHRSDG